MSSQNFTGSQNVNRHFNLWYLLAWFVGICLIVLLIVFFLPVDKLTEAEKQQQAAEKQRIAQMDEELHRAYDGDLLEFSDSSFAVVTNKNDFGLAIRYVIGNSVRQSYEGLATNVRVVYTKDHPGRCEALEKFIASF